MPSPKFCSDTAEEHFLLGTKVGTYRGDSLGQALQADLRGSAVKNQESH